MGSRIVMIRRYAGRVADVTGTSVTLSEWDL